MSKRMTVLMSIAAVVLLAVAVMFSGNDDTGPENSSENVDEPSGSSNGPQDEEDVQVDLGDSGVSASHPYAEEVGEAILADGGNAVDAAIAVAFTLGVVEPYGSGIGGGGAMLVLDDLNESPMVYDYREMSPAQGQENLAGVPGFVKGMQTVHENYATMSLDELLQPAINYAEGGFIVDDMLEDRLYQASARIDQESADPFYPGGIRIKEGMELVQEDLAQTMRRLLENGFDDFYTGELANELAGDQNSITVEDLQAYEVLESQAVSGEFNGYTVYSSPPPMSGVTLIQQLQMAETAGLTEMEPGSALFGHTFIESVRETYRDRSRNIGDPTTNPDINTDQLTSQAYSAGLLEEVDLDEINGDSEGIEASTDDQGNTTHFSIADSDGMVVSATNTLSNFFGEGVMVEQGYFLNNHMNNFAQTETSPNVYAGHKRSRSFITPTLLVDPANQQVIGMGSPGGNRIPQIMSQVLIYSAHLDSLEEAMNMPRITHGTHPETGERQVVVESSWPEESMEELAAMGHDVDAFYSAVYFGGLQVLVADFDEGQVQRITDPRR